MATVIVIGAGVGGLSTALRLRASGHDVTVHEAGSLGGKLASTTIDGFTFDTGPSLLTLPHVLHELFEYCGGDLGDHVELIRIPRPFRHRFVDGSSLDVFDDRAATRVAFESFAGAGAEWDAMMSHTEKIWEVSQRSFFAGEIGSPLAMLRRMRSPLDLLHIDPLRTLAERARSFFDDSRLQAWMNRFATYSGSSPYLAPATLSCIAYIEQHFGCWHVRGGLGRISSAMAALGDEVGIEVREGSAVSHIGHDGVRVNGVTLESGERIAGDVVVNNTDVMNLYSELLPNRAGLERARRAGRSSSVLGICLGLDGVSNDTAHHSLWYSADPRREFEQIFTGDGVAQQPTVYMCNPGAVDDSMAPEGREAWFGLVNVASGAHHDWETYADAIVDHIGVRDRVLFRHLVTPADLETRYRDIGGSIYGSSSNARRSAFLRASNRGPLKGLYSCGGSSHPGGGVPLAVTSGRIVADMVNEDFR